MFFISLLITLSGQKKVSKGSWNFEGSKNAFFVEVLGNGLLFSANYDIRVSNKFGIRVGIGYIGSTTGEGGILIVPVMGNFLLGNNGRYFEVGAD